MYKYGYMDVWEEFLIKYKLVICLKNVFLFVNCLKMIVINNSKF